MIVETLWWVDEKSLYLGYVLKVGIYTWKFIYTHSHFE